MTDTSIAPTEDETATEPDESIVLTPTGWIRVVIDGQRFRLRRPFFGELKSLRLALEAVTDEIAEKSDENERLVAKIMEEAEALAAEGNEGEASDKGRRTRLRNRSKVAARDLVETADQLRVDWWIKVFETLCVDDPKVPADWPSWVVDPNLPAQVTQHWRSAPLAPGQ